MQRSHATPEQIYDKLTIRARDAIGDISKKLTAYHKQLKIPVKIGEFKIGPQYKKLAGLIAKDLNIILKSNFDPLQSVKYAKNALVNTASENNIVVHDKKEGFPGELKGYFLQLEALENALIEANKRLTAPQNIVKSTDIVTEKTKSKRSFFANGFDIPAEVDPVEESLSNSNMLFLVGESSELPIASKREAAQPSAIFEESKSVDPHTNPNDVTDTTTHSNLSHETVSTTTAVFVQLSTITEEHETVRININTSIISETTGTNGNSELVTSPNNVTAQSPVALEELKPIDTRAKANIPSITNMEVVLNQRSMEIAQLLVDLDKKHELPKVDANPNVVSNTNNNVTSIFPPEDDAHIQTYWDVQEEKLRDDYNNQLIKNTYEYLSNITTLRGGVFFKREIQLPRETLSIKSTGKPTQRGQVFADSVKKMTSKERTEYMTSILRVVTDADAAKEIRQAAKKTVLKK